MNLSIKNLLFAFLLLMSAFAQAQDTDLRIGDWNTHNPYTTVVSVTQSAENIYYATAQAIIILEKDSREVSHITRVTGLSDVNIAKISYNSSTKKLLVAYQNGNLDVIDADGKITNLSDILRANVSGTRDVNHIYHKGTMAYLSCNFGLVQINVATLQFVTATFTPDRRAMSFALQHDTLWLATTKGLIWCTSQRNIQDFGQWRVASAAYTGVQRDAPSKHVVNFQNTLVAEANDSLFILKNNVWQFLYNNGNSDFHLISVEPTLDYLVVASHRDGGGDFMEMVYESGWKPHIYSDLVANIRETATERFSADSSHIWVADAWVGMGYYNTKEGTSKPFRLNSPQGTQARRTLIHPQDHALWVATGAVDGNFTYTYNSAGVARYKDGVWQNFNRGTNPTDLGKMLDVIAIVVRPSDGHVFAGMYASEDRPFMTEFDANGKFIRNYDKNSGTSMQAATGDAGSIRISGMAVDKQNNIWIVNRNAPNALSVLRSNGAWQVFNVRSTDIKDITIDENDIKWITANDGLIAFDDGDLDKNGDERIKVLTSSNAALGESNTVMTAVDLDGDVWVATAKGASVFQCGTSVFQDNTTCKGSRPLACINGICEELLKQNIVNCVAIDGANRKWFGTPSGIFVQSSDGRTTVANFNKDNAPLPSNDIQNITIDDRNGVVWISTSDGLVSYRNNSTLAAKLPVDASIVAFPNPVRPEYNGTIAINGFARDAIVKITDVSGALLYETTALGGQVIWNGLDYNGKRAATGVYMVYTSNKEGEQALVTKIAVVN